MSHVANRPYTVVWLGNVAGLRGLRGTLTSHKRPELATRAAIRQRDSLRPLWGSYPPWYVYQIIDARDGSVCGFIGG